jgi:hypothetical protein
MPIRFTCFPDPPVAGLDCTITLSNSVGVTFPMGCTATFKDANGNVIDGSGTSWQFVQGGTTQHTVHVPESAKFMDITSSQSATFSRTTL